MTCDERGRICAAGGVEFAADTGIKVQLGRVAGYTGAWREIDVRKGRFTARVCPKHPYLGPILQGVQSDPGLDGDAEVVRERIGEVDGGIICKCAAAG